MTDNPLSKYFRTPAIHLALPSKGKFYKPGVLDMPETGELPIMPMTAIDEITYKTPDALFNGSAIVDVIQSCVPSIKNAWEIPTVDLTAILAAIRIASFGHEMDIETQCPECDNIDSYSVDLRQILDGISEIDYSEELSLGDLIIKFKPMVYKDLNENNKLQFEEQKLANLLSDSEMDEEKQIKLLSETFKKVSEYTITTLAKNIDYIKTPEMNVTDESYILEFLQNCETDVFNRIKNAVIEQKNKEALKPLHIKCDECGHEYDQPFTLDMTSFFDLNS